VALSLMFPKPSGEGHA